MTWSVCKNAMLSCCKCFPNLRYITATTWGSNMSLAPQARFYVVVEEYGFSSPHLHQCKLVFLLPDFSWHQAFTQSRYVSCCSHQPLKYSPKPDQMETMVLLVRARRRRRLPTWTRLSSLNSNAQRNRSHCTSDLYPPRHPPGVVA